MELRGPGFDPWPGRGKLKSFSHFTTQCMETYCCMKKAMQWVNNGSMDATECAETSQLLPEITDKVLNNYISYTTSCLALALIYFILGYVLVI